jgi:hypothetical protein
MRKRARLVLAAVIGSAVVVSVAWVYRARTVGHAEVRTVTDRVAAAMAAGDTVALAADPALQDHPDTAKWLAARGPALAAGYRVSVQRNGANGYQLLDLETVSHVGVIETPAGTITLGVWRDPGGGDIRIVTAAESTRIAAPADPATGEIRVGRE